MPTDEEWVELGVLLSEPSPWYRTVRLRAMGWLERAWQFPRVHIWQGLRSLAYWLPVIWKDRQWDHIFLYAILRHKLKAMRALWLHNRWHTGWEKDAHRMRVCILLLDRMIDEDYLSKRDLIGRGGMHCIKVERYDSEYLFHLLGRYLSRWWD